MTSDCRFVVAAIVWATAMCASAAPSDASRYLSPDGKIQATFEAAGPHGDESALAIREPAGKLLLARSYASDDGDHGLKVIRAQWTNDSAFFVFTAASSGGHQPWKLPIFVYSRTDNAIYDLGACLGPVSSITDFQLKPPDILVLSLLGSLPKGYSEHDAISTKVSLGQLASRCKHE